MQNLEQIRARNVLAFAKEIGSLPNVDGGEVIKKIPPLLLNHGLLATVAYGFDEKKLAFRIVYDAIAKHLSDTDVQVVPNSVKSAETLMTYLTAKTTTSDVLKEATAEAMAWLQYARRFVKKSDDKKS